MPRISTAEEMQLILRSRDGSGRCNVAPAAVVVGVRSIHGDVMRVWVVLGLVRVNGRLQSGGKRKKWGD